MSGGIAEPEKEQLVNLFRSRLLDEKHPLRQMAFKVLFADKAGMREVPINNLRTKRGMGTPKTTISGRNYLSNKS